MGTLTPTCFSSAVVYEPQATTTHRPQLAHPAADPIAHLHVLRFTALGVDALDVMLHQGFAGRVPAQAQQLLGERGQSPVHRFGVGAAHYAVGRSCAARSSMRGSSSRLTTPRTVAAHPRRRSSSNDCWLV